ncbi:MAG: TolC family protein, partial [Syntrophothermus sp.]
MKLLLLVSFLFISVIIQAQKVWTLEDCVNYALENNLDIKKQVLTVENNKRQLLQSKLGMLPDFNANATNVWNFGQTIDMYTNTFANTTVRSNNFYLQSNMVLFNGLSKFNTVKQNQIELMASRYDLDVIKNNIALSVAGYYLDILFNQEIFNVAQQQLEITKDQVSRTGKRVEAGSAARGDLLNVQAQQATEELAMVDAENKLAISNLAIQQLIDIPYSRDFRIEKPVLKEVGTRELTTASVVYEHALNNRPEIKSADLRVRSAEKSLAITRGYLYPSFSFGGSWGTGYSGASQEVDPNVNPTLNLMPIGITQASRDTVYGYSWLNQYRVKSFNDQLTDNQNKSIGFYLQIPIFNGWQSRTNIAKAKIRRSQAELDLEIQKRTLRNTIEQSYADAVSALKRYNASLQKVTAQEESFKYTEQKYEVGMLTAFDFNNNKKDLAKAQSDLLQAKYD